MRVHTDFENSISVISGAPRSGHDGTGVASDSAPRGCAKLSTMRRFRRIPLAALLTAVLTVTGCATVVDGTAQPDPSAAARLDTGGYPTAPRQVPERTDPNDRRVQASYELSGHLIAPPELDKTFNWPAAASTPVLPSTVALGMVFGVPLVSALSQNESYVGGAVSARQTALIERAQPNTARMRTGVIRYRTADNATAAARAVREAVGSNQSAPIADHADAFLGTSLLDHDLTKVWWMPFQDYLLVIGFGNVADTTAESLAKSWIDRQTTALRAVTVTTEQMLALPPDRDGIMSLTLPDVVRTGDGAQLALGYLAPQAWANAAADDWLATKTLLERAGVDLIAAAGSTVTRTRSATSARYLADAYRTGEDGGSGNATEERGAAGVPDSRCASSITRANGDPRKAYTCSFTAGRYYVATGAVSTLTQAHQQAAASYLMVKDAK